LACDDDLLVVVQKQVIGLSGNDGDDAIILSQQQETLL